MTRSKTTVRRPDRAPFTSASSGGLQTSPNYLHSARRRSAVSGAAMLAAAVVASLVGAPGALAQAPTSVTANSKIQFSGSVDTYYDFNPAAPHSHLNQLQNWTFDANQFALPLVELQAQETPDAAHGAPLGFKLVLAYGRVADWINAGEPGTTYKPLKEAYFTYVARGKSPRPITINLGKFVTPAGEEVIETQSNFNYTHGLLFSWAIPYYHMGVSASMPISPKLTGTVMLVNGWNNVVDNNNAKTVGVTAAFTPNSRWASSTNIIVGPEIAGDDHDYRELLDEVLTLTPNAKWSFAGEYDYAHDKAGMGGPNVKWQGVGGWAHYVHDASTAYSFRAELFNDHDGAAIVPPGPIAGTVLPAADRAPAAGGGAPQEVKEVTLTLEKKFHPRLTTRFEVREDWSTARVFDKGTPAVPGTGNARQQTQFVIGNIFTF